MSRRVRREVKIHTVDDVTELGKVNKETILADNKKYEIENYNPLENLDEKEVLVPERKTQMVSIRLTEKENEMLNSIARENGLSKSALLRMIVTRSLREGISLRASRFFKKI